MEYQNFVRRKIIALLLAMLATFLPSQMVYAKVVATKIQSKDYNGGRLKTLLVPGEFHVVKDGVVFDCYSSGNYDITLEDEDGNIMFHGSIAAIEGQSYFIYICGLNPDVDDIFD